MKALKAVLVVLGVLCFLSSAPAIVLPWSGVVRGLEGLGLEAPVGDAFVVYCVRLSSLGFALIGIFFLILAADPLRYRPMLVLAVCGLWLMAAAALVTGWLAQMQPPWYLGDFAACLIAALLLLAFWPRQVEPAAPQ